jgi:hypothetical protein
MSSIERIDDLITGEIDPYVLISPAVGEIAMPPEPKKTYIHIKKGTNQLVIEHYANAFDTIPIPVD